MWVTAVLGTGALGLPPRGLLYPPPWGVTLQQAGAHGGGGVGQDGRGMELWEA